MNDGLMWGVILGILVTILAELLIWVGYCMGKEDRK